MSSNVSDRVRRLAPPLLLALIAGCASPIRATLPDDFLELDGPPRELKAVTADDARLWVREFPDRDGGQLEFWSDSLRNDLIEQRGYEPLGEPEEITDGTGRRGIVQTYAVRHLGADQRYLIAVFVLGSGKDQRVRTAEFVAPTALFDGYVDDIRTALRSLEP